MSSSRSTTGASVAAGSPACEADTSQLPAAEPENTEPAATGVSIHQHRCCRRTGTFAVTATRRRSIAAGVASPMLAARPKQDAKPIDAPSLLLASCATPRISTARAAREVPRRFRSSGEAAIARRQGHRRNPARSKSKRSWRAGALKIGRLRKQYPPGSRPPGRPRPRHPRSYI